MKTFELVLVGHPDKVCDGLAETFRKANPLRRSAIEVGWFNDLLVIGGESDYDYPPAEVGHLVSRYLLDVVGLTMRELGKITIDYRVRQQSAEINNIVGNIGTGDNGIFFGGWHKVYSPVIQQMKRLCERLDQATLKKFGYRTDGKMIFSVDDTGTVEYLTINVASYRDPDPDALRKVIRSVVDANFIAVNPKGDWQHCFGFADAGLTNRKIACDTQCGLFRVGGGGLFGKDRSKADFTLNAYLPVLAKELIQNTKQVEIELFASTIIGDETVYIYNNKTQRIVKHIKYEECMRLAPKLNVFGGTKYV